MGFELSWDEIGAATRSALYDVSIRLLVHDPGQLWQMAAAQALKFGDGTQEDVEDMLGPMEDPSITDCIAMLVGPRPLAGCSFEAFSVTGVGLEGSPLRRLIGMNFSGSL